MTKTTFELEFEASTASSAISLAEEKISDFLGIPSETISSKVDMELKVKTAEDGKTLKVTVFASVKRNQVTPL
jgi:hypothetical protein